MSPSSSNYSKPETRRLKVFKKGLGIAVVCIWLSASTSTWAQEIKPVAGFQQDSVKIGMSIPYTLSVKYPISMDVVFPDSLHDYSPFEYDSRTYYTTKSDSIYSYDSVVYYLSTFEIDSIQYLSLPILLRNKRDSSRIFPDKDSVILIHLIEQLPDSIQMIENIAYLNTPTQFNYPYYIIALIILGIVALTVLLVFGKVIRRKFLLKRMNRQYQKFITQYDKLIFKLQSDSSIKAKEDLVIFWKKYLEKIERKPYTKLTTKELVKINKEDEALKTALQNIDRAIYGNISDITVEDSFVTLKTTASNKYQGKVTEIKTNG